MSRWAYIGIALAAAAACQGSTEPQHGSAPVARAGGPYVSTDGKVHFDGRASIKTDTSLSYAWTFGDGGTGASDTLTHTYSSVGHYVATLVVTDKRGLSSTPDTTAVTVQAVTPPVDTAGIVFAGAGNIATCRNDNDEATARLLDALPGYVFTVGDNAFDMGSAADYANCYEPTWGRHKARTYPVLGNHEYLLGNADAAFDYFGARLGTRGKGYYSFDLGPSWHIIVLNDNGTFVPFASGSEQELWLKADLAASVKQCTIALWHTPLFISTNTAGYTVNPTRKILWDDLYAAGVDIVLSAQEHHYERLLPTSPDGVVDPSRGIREFNVGTGGESTNLPTVAIHPNSEVRSAAFGVLKLTLRAGRYDWQFLPIAGQTFTDSGSGQCH